MVQENQRPAQGPKQGLAVPGALVKPRLLGARAVPMENALVGLVGPGGGVNSTN